MANMTFDGNTLTWGADSWTATSGPYGAGPLPPGTYNVDRAHCTPLTTTIAKGYRDPVTGMGFFVPIKPQFSTGRWGLGIHPDGGVPGTNGCIGIKSNSASFYSKLGHTDLHTDLTLDVTG